MRNNKSVVKFRSDNILYEEYIMNKKKVLIWFTTDAGYAKRYIGEFLLTQESFQSFENFHQRVCHQFKRSPDAKYWIMLGSIPLVAFNKERSTLQYIESTPSGFSYRLWNYFHFPKEKFKLKIEKVLIEEDITV